MIRFVFGFFLLISAQFLGGIAHAGAEGTNTTPAREAFILDDTTGTVLFEKNPDQRMPTSSMSKTMTMYLVFEALKSGKLTLDQKFPVSEKAWRMQGSKMFVSLGSQVSVEDLIRGVVIQSGNDATIVLAEGLAGSESRFAEMMNEKASDLGMKNSHFANASGWPDPDHYSTARDLAILARHLIHDFPEFYPYFSEMEFKYNNIQQYNRNPLLRHRIGADGVKTGHAEEAGYGLIGSGVRDGRRVIMVLNGLPDMKSRETESVRLLEWALSAFENRTLFSAGSFVGKAPVILGAEDSVPIAVPEALLITAPKNAATGIRAESIYDAPLRAPVSKGDSIGILRIDTPLLGLQDFPLVAGADIPASGFFRAAFQKIKIRLLGSGIASPPPHAEMASAEGTP